MATDPDPEPESESELPPASFGDGRDPGTDPNAALGYCDFALNQDNIYECVSNQCAFGCTQPPAPNYETGGPSTVRVTCVAGG